MAQSGGDRFVYIGKTGTGVLITPIVGIFSADGDFGYNGLRTWSSLIASNGTTFDNLRDNAASVLNAALQKYALMVANPAEWSASNAPAVNTQAIATKAAVAGQTHVVRSITATLVDGSVAAAPLATPILVQLLDGVTVIWSKYVNISAVIGAQVDIELSGLNIVITNGNSVTLQFSAAGGANTFESVAMTGYTVS